MGKATKGNFYTKKQNGPQKMTEAQKAAAKVERAAPNIRIIARQDRFRHFLGDGSMGHEMSCAGRLMLVGAFDGLDVSPEAILSALLDYSNGYWGNFTGGARMSDYQREVFGLQASEGETDPETGLPIDKAGRWFEAYDAVLRDCGRKSRQAVHEITVDRHWFPDEDCGWAGAVINRRIANKIALLKSMGKPVPETLFVAGELSSESDEAMLSLVRFGANVLAQGLGRKKAA